MKIVIITSDFSGFTGSEIVALEVANYFAAQGSRVTVRAERHSDALRPYLHPKVEIARKRVDIADYDLVWSQHGHFALNTSDLSRLKNWKGRFISVHLSGSTPAETYHHPFASRFALTRVFNCSRSKEILEQDFSVVGKSFNLRNAAPAEFHKPPRALARRVRRLLVVSNHLPEEMCGAIRLAEEYGIEVCHLGAAGTYRLILPDDIANADAVITIGKTVQYSLCSAKPVYCYDHFGGPGWLNSENFELAEHQNFSGRCHPKRKSSKQIFTEVIDGFEQAEKFAASNWESHSNRYGLDKFMDELLSVTGGHLFNNERCLEEIDSMRGALMHVQWIWRDVFSRYDIENKGEEVLDKDVQARMFALEDILTDALRNPWLPITEALLRRLAYLAAWVAKPISKRSAKRFRNSARKRDPLRYISPDRTSNRTDPY